MAEGRFDYIVVGGGSAGCAVAARLSEDPGTRVLLLEAGPRDRNFWIHLPIGYYRTIYNPKVARSFTTEPEPHLDDREVIWPRGKVLGGCSSINGLVYARGQPADYDHWRQLGNEGWSWDEVLPFFKKSEDYPHGDDALRGRGGPLKVSGPSFRPPLMLAYIEAAKQAGIPENPDYNGAVQDGVAWFQLTVRNGWRWSAAKSYLRPALGRPNLAIQTDAFARRLVLEGRRVVGVEYETGGHTVAVRAEREVILSAGALQSPHLLLLSGIGPGEALQAQGLEVRHELPGVGKNLQDHFQARIVYRSGLPATLNDAARTLFGRARMGLEWALGRRGWLTVGAGVVTLFWRTRPELETPDIQFHVIPFSADKPGAPLHDFSGYVVSVCQLRPESRGELSLRSADPREPPRIRANYLAAETDRRTILDGLKLIRRIADQPALKDYREAEVTPGPDCRTDEELMAYVRARGGTIFHPAGTCKMGPASDPMAVVDPRLRVHGLEGVRIADCSIMPTVVSGNTNAPAIMIGEKLAAMLKAA